MRTRPDLSFLTQGLVIWDIDNDPVIYGASINENVILQDTIVKIPQLIQLAEMLFDMTAHEPDSLVHQMASKTLNDIAK